MLSRRQFLASTAKATAAATLGSSPARAANPPLPAASDEALDRALATPAFDPASFKEPLIIESLELLKAGKDHVVRVRAKGGAEGISIDNGRADILHPLLNKLVFPYFVGTDARDVEQHLFGVYRHRDNYKFQGLSLWCAVALVEFAILDLLGRVSGRTIAQILGQPLRDRIPFYIASGRRDTTPEQEIAYLQRLVAESGAKAIKYRLGGRMNRDVDAMPGRTETLIPLTRKVFGDKMAIHGDANSSYSVKQAIRIGKIMEDIKAEFYEEPCPFDDFDSTKKVTDALTIPIALGEQESSEWRFKQHIRERVSDIVQPDLFYYGGLIRSLRVARMAALRNMPATAHISGGFGFVYMLHFASIVPNCGPWQEYKEGVKVYGNWFSPALKIVDGAITVPTGPGVGIANPAELLKNAVVVKS